jgi:hypothetical protein
MEVADTLAAGGLKRPNISVYPANAGEKGLPILV